MCPEIDNKITSKFQIAIALTAVTLLAEVIGGFWTNSLALLSDAAHVFNHKPRVACVHAH